MNLLDQLYQYSLRSEGESLSLSAISCDQKMQVSSDSHRSSTVTALSPSKRTLSTWFSDSKADKMSQNDVQNREFTMKMQVYNRTKEKYRKLSKIVQLFGNKIRKMQYEFMVKLEHKHKDSQLFVDGIDQCQLQLTKSLILDEISNDLAIHICQKICQIHQKYAQDALEKGFLMLSKNSKFIQKLQYLFQTMFSIFKNKKTQQGKYFLSHLKDIVPKINKSSIIQSSLNARKAASKVENAINSSFQSHENRNLKLLIFHPQRKQMQKIDICDNFSIFMSQTQEIFQKQQLYTIKKVQQDNFVSQKRKSDLTNISLTASQREECPKLQEQYVFDQKFRYQVPLFDLTESAYFKHQEQSSPQSFKNCSKNQQLDVFSEVDYDILVQRFSLAEQQSQLNKYIIFRRSIQKKKYSTLKDIEQSKQTIKKIVYQLQKSKAKNQKQKIKLTNKKISFKHKSTEMKSPVAQSKACSPLRPKSIGNKTARVTPSIKCEYDSQIKPFSTRDYQYSDILVNEGVYEYEKPSKNMEVYYNYMKAKRKSVKMDEISNKKQPSKHQTQVHSSKKTMNQKQNMAQSGHLVINKQPALRQPRIDVKVDLSKSVPNARSQKQKLKGVKTSRK